MRTWLARENLKKDAEIPRNVKLPPISRPLCCASTDDFERICVFVIFVMVRFSVVTSQSPNVLPRTENQKGKKGKKSAPINKGLLLTG